MSMLIICAFLCVGHGMADKFGNSENTAVEAMYGEAETASRRLSGFSPATGNDLRKATSCGGNCTGQNGPIGEWDVSSVTDMTKTFFMAKDFNDDISKWVVSSATNMSGMFAGAEGFDGDISNWDVSRVTDMNGMFFYARNFSQDTSRWDVSRVTATSWMFYSGESFNQDISGWDVSRVTTMEKMFAYAKAFNQDISHWDVSSVTNMINLFWGGLSFNQTLCGTAWVNSQATKTDMFGYGGQGSISTTVCEPPPTPTEASTAASTVAVVTGEVLQPNSGFSKELHALMMFGFLVMLW